MQSSADAELLCRQLTAGEGPAVLVADFQTLNGTRRLSELLGDAAAGQRIYQVDPLGALTGKRLYVSLQDMADESTAGFRSFESPEATDQRVFVVGHCSATGLGMRVANLLADTREVTAILVQPTWPGTEHVTERFAEFQRKLGAGSGPCPDLEGDPWDCVEGIEKIYRAALVELAAGLNLDPDNPSFTSVLGTYRGWVSFLLACRNDQPAQAPSDAVTVSVLSSEPGFVFPGTSPGRCRVTPPPSLERPDAVTPELARLVLDQIAMY
jgi:hypothetical protein